MNYAYLEAYRKRKKERLASEIDFSEDENFSKSDTSGNSVFLASYRKRKKKLLAAELNIVETPSEVSKEKKGNSSKGVPQNHGSFGAAVNFNQKAAEPLQLMPQNRESSVPDFYEGKTFRSKESKSLSDDVNSERSNGDKNTTVSKRRFNRFSEEINDGEPINFFDEPNSDSTLLTSGLDSHSNLVFFDRESDSFRSDSDMHSDSDRSTGGFVSNAVKSNTINNSGIADKKNEQKKPSKGKAKVAILLALLIAIACGSMLIFKTHNDSLSSDDENTSSYVRDNTKQNITKATEQTEDTLQTDATTTTVTTTTESTAVSSKQTTATTAMPAIKALRPGTENDDVLRMQKRLAELGYITEESCTGFYGDYTKRRLKTFQKNAGLKETGVADVTTLERLYADDAPKQ